LWPSALNALEAAANQDSQGRQDVLSTIAAIAGSRLLLPLPMLLLRQSAKALIEGRPSFTTAASGLDWLPREPERISAEQVRRAGEILRQSQQAWEVAHRRGRQLIRHRLRERGGRDPWGSVAAFLEQQWTRPAQLDSFIEHAWRRLGLPGSAPVDALLADEGWRLYYEGIGATVYERCVPNQTMQPAHIADVAQLVYLAYANKRVLLTNDSGLYRVAQAVLRGRYSNVRVMRPIDLLSAAG
jgi:hypothetical protein